MVTLNRALDKRVQILVECAHLRLERGEVPLDRSPVGFDSSLKASQSRRKAGHLLHQCQSRRRLVVVRLQMAEPRFDGGRTIRDAGDRRGESFEILT